MNKKNTLSVWLTRLAWGLIVLDVILSLIPTHIFIPGAMNAQTAVLLLFVIAIWIIGTLCAATTWLIIHYRAFFRTWIGWIIPFPVLILSGAIAQGALPVKFEVLRSLSSMLQLVSLWSIIPITVLRLWHKDVGLRMASWGSLLVIWGYFGAWRYKGNLIEGFLLSLSDPSQIQSFWWFSPLMCIFWWVIPISIVGFVGHTIRLLICEFKRNEF